MCMKKVGSTIYNQHAIFFYNVSYNSLCTICTKLKFVSIKKIQLKIH